MSPEIEATYENGALIDAKCVGGTSLWGWRHGKETRAERARFLQRDYALLAGGTLPVGEIGTAVRLDSPRHNRRASQTAAYTTRIHGRTNKRPTISTQPAVLFRTTSFIAQGVSAGLEYRW